MSSLVRIATLAANTVREAVRNRVLYTLVFFALLLIGTGVLLSSLSYVEQERILQDVGLAAIRIFGAAIAIFVGIGLIHNEVDRRTIYTILSKPLSRTEFLLGKYFGLLATLVLQLAIMGIAFAACSLLTQAPLGAAHVAALGMVAIEIALLVALATLFSVFTTPTLASLFTVALYLIGHLTRNLRDLGQQSHVAAVREITALLHRILPDLESFNLSTQAVHGLPVTASDVWLPFVYGTGYVVLVLYAASVIFERRDFR
jgi:ABC-type transport system involved in multi-copper enzyme maturation permease subunit